MSEPSHRDLELLFAYIDGELDKDERLAFEARLRSEPALAAELEGMSFTQEVVSQIEVPEPPPLLADKVEHRIRRRSRGRYFSENKGAGESLAWSGIALLIVAGIIVILSFSLPVALPPVDNSPLPADDAPHAPAEEPASTPPEAQTAPTVEPETPKAPSDETGADAPPAEPPPSDLDAPPTSGSLAPQPHRPVQRYGFAWSVASELELDELERQARARFGASRLSVDDGVITVTVERAGWEEAMRRVSDLGAVYRDRVELAAERSESRQLTLLPAGVEPSGAPLR